MMSKKNKDLIVIVDDKEYSFNSIIQRTIHAPINKISVERLLHCKPSGIETIDNSELRVCRIDKEWKVLTGYSKVLAAVHSTLKPTDGEKITPVEADAIPADVVVAKVMSVAYLESTAIPPTTGAMAVRFQKAGFKVVNKTASA